MTIPDNKLFMFKRNETCTTNRLKSELIINATIIDNKTVCSWIMNPVKTAPPSGKAPSTVKSWKLRYLKGTPFERPQDARVFFSRISPKPGRIDYVAQPIGEIRGAKAQRNNPINERFVIAWHDYPIQQAWLQGNAKRVAMETIKQDLPTASQFLQEHIRNYLNF